ncbi:hypothetical protein LTR08_005376 [Meristemomyces frigidus]|nr:hypothetical protein LTR08_005376 [Meristemomyces frigidus]
MERREDAVDVLALLAERVRAEDVRFPRRVVDTAGAVLAWTAFWALANRNQHNARAVALHWACVFVAAWLAYSY